MTVLPRLVAGMRSGERLGLEAHHELHGRLQLESWAPDALIREVGASGLRGRGGGAFPTAAKLEAVAGERRRGVVVANGAEGEPMSSKDGLLLEGAPHAVLDGALAAAHAVGAREVIVAVPAQARRALRSTEVALRERRDSSRVRIVTTPSRFLAGEETALVRVLDGGPCKPTLVPPRPAQRGVARRPTLVQNVETLAHVALLARHGAGWFRDLGDDGVPGTALVTLSGSVAGPGVYEIASGTPFDELLALAGGPTEPVRAVLVGGYFGAWISAQDAAGLALHADATPAPLGAGVLVVLGETRCPVAEVARAMSWLAAQTAGQCGPCVHGLAALASAVARVAAGQADDRVGPRLARWSDQVDGRGACQHPNGAVRFLRSALRSSAPSCPTTTATGRASRARVPPCCRRPAPRRWSRETPCVNPPAW